MLINFLENIFLLILMLLFQVGYEYCSSCSDIEICNITGNIPTCQIEGKLALSFVLTYICPLEPTILSVAIIVMELHNILLYIGGSFQHDSHRFSQLL